MTELRYSHNFIQPFLLSFTNHEEAKKGISQKMSLILIADLNLDGSHNVIEYISEYRNSQMSHEVYVSMTVFLK